MMAAHMAPGMNRSFLAEKWENLLPRKLWYEAADEAADLVMEPELLAKVREEFRSKKM